ncbi:MAG TPA: 50S ribosomal protein L18 [Bacteroidota bacterium]|jgi:large subunit ribosomal protein L18|nr:50S ribosomal protein L18 [Bacteroidota bacterium]
MITKSRSARHARIKTRVSKKIRGTAERPRFTVFRSLNHLYAQIVDDSQAKTLVAASSLTKDLKGELKEIKGQKEKAKRLGAYLAKKAVAQNLKRVVFDRNGYMFHGVIKSLADGAREGGLEF